MSLAAECSKHPLPTHTDTHTHTNTNTNRQPHTHACTKDVSAHHLVIIKKNLKKIVILKNSITQ